MNWKYKRRCDVAGFKVWVAATVAFGWATLSTPALAQGPSLLPSEDSKGSVSAELEEIEKKSALLRTTLAEWKAKSTQYAEAWQQAPERLKAIQEAIDALSQSEPPSVNADMPGAQLEIELAKAQQDLALARREANELETEAAQRSERRKRVPELLAAATDRLQKLGGAPVSAPDRDPEVFAALSELHQLRRAVIEAEIESYNNEISSYDARGVLLAKRRDQVSMRIARAETAVASLQAAVDAYQRQEVARQAEKAEQLLSKLDTFPSGIRKMVRALAQQNTELANKWTGDDGVVDKIKGVDEKLARAAAQVASVDSELIALQEKVEAAGLKDSVGMLLRKQRADAPDVGMYRRFIRMRQDLIGSVQLELIRLREQRDELTNIDSLVEQAMRELDKPIDLSEQARVEETLRQLFETQREYLDSLVTDYEAYFQKLLDFDTRQQELIERTERLTTFIDERVLWIPSSAAVKPKLLKDAVPAVQWLTSPRFIDQLRKAAVAAIDSSTPLSLAVALFAALMLLVTRRLGRAVVAFGEEARSDVCVDYLPTLRALGRTLLRAVWLPFTLAFLAWQVGRSPEATLYVRSVTDGLWAVAAVWLSLRLPRELLRPRGVVEAHCGWPDAPVAALRRHMGWLIGVMLPAAFLIFALERRGEDVWTGSLGRLAFVVVCAALAAFVHLALKERGPLWQVLVARRGAPRRPWMGRAVHVAAVLMPVLLGAAALRGFYWTALQLTVRLHFTFVFLFVVWVAVDLTARWLMIARRRIAIEQARQRLEARQAQIEAAAAAGEAETAEEVPAEPEVDLTSVEMQTGRLVIGAAILAGALGVVGIWADIFPAAGILRQVDLWSVTQTVTVNVPDASGVDRASLENQLVPVTLADLLIALLIAGLTLALIRNLPGVLEVSLFRRLSAGERYAYITIVKYAIAVVGVTLAFDAIGLGWANIQWLVAAVGLGLGFGLQEIFANFVSGLIILFERPIRVGDTVTVGNISGTVSRIRIRATWITSFDRKELVVPNKEFVTAQLVNWSLSDAVLRVAIPVGIAYGSDTDKAVAELQRLADENDLVLRDPPPRVLFLGFGDSSLSFELRVFIANVSHLFQVQHQLHMSIDKAFREADIEIAFPQRDLHIRTVPEAWKPQAG